MQSRLKKEKEQIKQKSRYTLFYRRERSKLKIKLISFFHPYLLTEQ